MASIDPRVVATPEPVAAPKAAPQAASRSAPRAAPSAFALAFTPAADVEAGEAFTRELAHSHYENFSVVSRLLPADLRQDFCNVYAFCRLADDLADEQAAAPVALRHLERFREALRQCYGGRPETAVYRALQRTIERCNIPIQPFLDLIDAFEQDQQVTRYETFDDLREYCRRSANPVGRLVLYVCGYRDAERQRLSDFTCTALQLANFWQDVRRDLHDLDRIYLPRASMEQFGVSEDDLRRDRAGDNVRRMIRFEVDRTEAMFKQGDALLPLLAPRVRRQVALFGAGGRAVLQAIRRQDYDTLVRRPVLSRWQKGRLAARVVACELLGRWGRG